MGLLNKEALLKKETLKVEKVEFGDGNYVCVREMTGRERDKFENSLMVETQGPGGRIVRKFDPEDFRAKLAAATVCDDSGKLLLGPKDVELLSENMTAAKLELIVNCAQLLNRITPRDRDALAKNSGSGQNAASTSGSAKS